MGSLSEKIKIVYLLIVIFFAIGVFLYLLDSWGLIRLEDHIPGLAEEAPELTVNDDHPTELEWLRLEKEQARLKEMEVKLDSEKARLDEMQKELESKRQNLQERESGLKEARQIFEDKQKEAFVRDQMISEMAERLVSMPPEDAVKIIAGWSNTDAVDVFWKMESNAAAQGKKSIVPYLLTLIPAERSAILTSLMMDAEAQRLAVSNP
ncbi:MAG: hypothetical protein KDK39_10900 [Leptospiraceae bacterium]|nr:hypothetical protein [Leptospiraceae bacterium]